MNGILLIDKDRDCTSHDVVARVRRILGTKAVGHAGTLDPLATGLLCLLVGEATKLSDYILNGDKTYLVTVRLGLQTDTLDRTGAVISDRQSELQWFDPEVIRERVETAAQKLAGALNLEVPAFSAVKVSGEKLYEKARRDEQIELPVREMVFHQVAFVGHPEGHPCEFQFALSCSKGSYVRSWVHALGQSVGFGATVAELRRLRSEPFSVEQAVTLEDLKSRCQEGAPVDPENLGAAWYPMIDALPHFDRVNIHGRDVQLLRNGQISQGLQSEILRRVRMGGDLGSGPQGSEAAPGGTGSLRPLRVVDAEEKQLVALLTAQPGEFYKIKRVFRPV